MTVDLEQVRREAEAREAQRQHEEYEAAIVRTREWDRRMTRAFKGIVPSPKRRRNLAIAAAKFDA